MTPKEKFIQNYRPDDLLTFRRFVNDLTALMQLPGRSEVDREANNVGSEFYFDPRQLTTFKCGFISCYDWLTQHREQPEATITKLVNTIGSKEKVKAYCNATSHSFESFSAGINYAIDRISTKFEWEELNKQPEAKEDE